MALISRVSRKKPESYVCRLLEKALSVRNWFGLHDLIGFDARAKLRTEEEVKRKRRGGEEGVLSSHGRYYGRVVEVFPGSWGVILLGLVV